MPQPESRPSRFRSGWVWIPLSFIFLLLGVVLGFQVALTYRSSAQSSLAEDPYTLELSAVRLDGQLHLKWNPKTLPFRQAQRGILVIQDGVSSPNSLSLTAEDLSRGGLLYRNPRGVVTFRLEVFAKDRVAVAETLEVKTP